MNNENRQPIGEKEILQKEKGKAGPKIETIILPYGETITLMQAGTGTDVLKRLSASDNPEHKILRSQVRQMLKASDEGDSKSGEAGSRRMSKMETEWAEKKLTERAKRIIAVLGRTLVKKTKYEITEKAIFSTPSDPKIKPTEIDYAYFLTEKQDRQNQVLESKDEVPPGNEPIFCMKREIKQGEVAAEFKDNKGHKFRIYTKSLRVKRILELANLENVTQDELKAELSKLTEIDDFMDKREIQTALSQINANILKDLGLKIDFVGQPATDGEFKSFLKIYIFSGA